MHKHHITKLLGLQQGEVKNIKYFTHKGHENAIHAYITTKSKYHECPSCKEKTNHIHDYREQIIQHFPINNSPVFLHLRKRRYLCTHCGKRFYETYSFLQKYFRKTNHVFNNIVAGLKENTSLKAIAKRNFISIPTVTRYMMYEMFLNNNMVIRELPEKIGIDEFKGNCNATKYLFHIYDLENHKTIDILEGRDYNTLEKYFSNIENRQDVKVVSMDLYAPFKRIIKDKFSKADIIADYFHVTKQVMKSLDDLRIQIWRDTKTDEKKYFKGIKRPLAKKYSALKPFAKEILNYAFNFNPILKYAHSLKEQFLEIKDFSTYEEKEAAFKKWLNDADSSTIQEFKTCIQTLRNWHKYISNYFRTGISNGPVEGKNNLIKVLKRVSFGFRNFDHFRARILLQQI